MYFEVLKNLIHILAFIWILKQSICVFNCASNCYYNSGIYCTPSSILYSDNCKNYCKPKYIGSNKQCVYCYPKATSYYTIEENGNCLVDQCIGNKIIDHTLECTDRDISLYKLDNLLLYRLFFIIFSINNSPIIIIIFKFIANFFFIFLIIYFFIIIFIYFLFFIII